jgi:pimeloyl-ACP methyl ester carboxylesterase
VAFSDYLATLVPRSDTLMVVASTEQFDPSLFAQPALKRFVEGEKDRGLDASLKGARDSLGKRGKVRALDMNADDAPDWSTSELSLNILRPLETARIPEPSAHVELGAGVSMLGHPALRADVSLTALGDVGRALGSLSVPSIFRDDPESSEPFMFETARDSDSGLGALILRNVQNSEAVGPDTPLVMRWPTTLRPDEYVVAYAWDGKFHLPLGVARNREGGTEIRLTVLPKPLELAGDVERGIVSSIRIMFQKIVSKYLPIGYDYPRLSAVSYDEEGDADYESSPEKVRERVAVASNILLFVHGILGDTFGMTASAATQTKAADGSAHRLVDMFDLIMAFDYENIETDIETTARALKSRLAAVGLGPNHGKKVTVAAHSMSGLVSRWFIEREGGNLVFGRLVTLGTPHAGSPWSTIEDWAMTALAIGLNGLSQVAWPVRMLGGIAGCIERVDVTLDQISPESVFLANLRDSGDPSIPYTLLIGNTSIIPPAIGGDMLAELLQRLSPQRVLYATTSLAFLSAPNDIAVAVASAGAVPKDRTPKPTMVEVACDHVTFFVSEAGRCALTDALRRN